MGERKQANRWTKGTVMRATWPEPTQTHGYVSPLGLFCVCKMPYDWIVIHVRTGFSVSPAARSTLRRAKACVEILETRPATWRRGTFGFGINVRTEAVRSLITQVRAMP